MTWADEIALEITNDWLETFAESKTKGETLADSVFWRLAMGVNGDDPRVQAALHEIKASVEARKS